MYEGEIVGELDPKMTTQEELDGFLRAFDACYTRLTQL